MFEGLLPEEKKLLTAKERDYLIALEERKQPTCPGCGRAMYYRFNRMGDGWFGWYSCIEMLGGCGAWATKVQNSKSVILAAERSYKQAMKRFEE